LQLRAIAVSSIRTVWRSCGLKIAALSGLATVIVACSSAEPADLVLTNASIYTLDADRPWAEAMAVRDGRIVALGRSDDIRRRYRGTERDVQGAMVLPGFHDSHVHPIDAGVDLARCDLGDADTVEEILATLADCDERDRRGDWLLGYGWSLGLFTDGNPHKSLLDGIAADRPILLQGADGHSTWANSAALALAGLDAGTPDTALGVIERDPDGSPSGTVRESAQQLLWSLVTEPSIAELEAALRRAVDILNSFGVTSLIEANADSRDLTVYGNLAAAGELNARVVLSIDDSVFDELAPQLAERLSAVDASRLRAGAVKIFVDGVLEGETAALLEPYSGARGGHRGRLNLPAEALARRVTELDAAGVQVHMHAIGDWAVQAALDAAAAARSANGARDNRHHIAHLQLVDPGDYGRFAALDVTANFQAVWAFPDDYIVNINTPQVGSARVERMYPIGSIARAGGRIVAGSDWNVTTPNPLVAIEVALTRQDPSGERTGVLNAREAVDLETMLRAYTVNGAWLMKQEQVTGRLAPGMSADFVILERNLFEIPAAEIGETRVLATYLDGEAVFEADARD
jgi:predicted amidohydrolase YtcJ